jgi:hypothetical protein
MALRIHDLEIAELAYELSKNLAEHFRSAYALRRDMLRSLRPDSLAWLAEPKLAKRAKDGGARRDRTADLLHAMQALSQLSYGPLTRVPAGGQHAGHLRTQFVTKLKSLRHRKRRQ